MTQRPAKLKLAIFIFFLVCTAALAAIDHNYKMNRGAEISYATSTSDITKVKLLLKQGYDPNAKGYKGSKPIYWAAFRRNHEMLNLLIQSGAVVSGAEGVRALLAAVDMGDIEIVKTLLKHGANPNSVGPQGETAFERAKNNHKTEILTLFHRNASATL